MQRRRGRSLFVTGTLRPCACGAVGFNEAKGGYVGVAKNTDVSHQVGEGILVRRKAVPADESADSDSDESSSSDDSGQEAQEGGGGDATAQVKPQAKRFFASIAIDPDRAGVEVARIMDGLLVELTRAQGSELQLTLEIDGSVSAPGYPEDVVDTVKANARDLKIDQSDYGFEQA